MNGTSTDPDHAVAASLGGVLAAHEKYRRALFEMLHDIGLEPHEGRSPEQAFARVLVACVIGGTPLPQGHYERYDVIGRDGCRVVVYTVDDGSHAMNGWVVNPSEVEGVDAVALVTFVEHRPTAVHLVPIGRVAAVSDALGVGSATAGSLTMNRALSDILVMEPVVSAAMGVETTLLP